MKQYLTNHNQSPFIIRHPSLDYHDKDHECQWDIELDFSWMKSLLE